MAAGQIVPGVYEISFGMVRAFLIADDQGLTLIDTGMPGSAGKILKVVQELGRAPRDVRQILVTQCHQDHAGGLAALKKETGAAVYMHPAEAALVEAGQAWRPVRPAPGPINALLYRLLIAASRHPEIEPATIEHMVHDGEVLPFAGGLQAIHTPGHTVGHLAFLWPHQGGVLFVGDAASNMFRLGYPPIFEDQEMGIRSLAKLAALDFEVACFAHGRPIVGGAGVRFRQKWG